MCLVWRFAAIVGCAKLSCIKKLSKYKKCIVDVLERKLTSSVLVCGLSGFCVIELFVATMRMAQAVYQLDGSFGIDGYKQVLAGI